MFWGYIYALLRANLLDTASFFTYDAGVLGLYLARLTTDIITSDFRAAALRAWVLGLTTWPFLLLLLPFQTLMISLVGLRGNVFFIVFMLLGSRFTNTDLISFSRCLALLNLFSFGFAIAEYFMGIERFFPQNAVTALMYASADIGGAMRLHRIPGTFGTAHTFAAAMLGTLPYLFGAFVEDVSNKWKLLYLCGIVAALFGVLMAGTRVFFVEMAAMMIIAPFMIRLSTKLRLLWFGLILLVGVAALTNERFQRFKSLSDSSVVSTRVSGSVNRSFVEIMFQHPMGNGLGGGGTSIPVFLLRDLRKPVSIESEYGRIMLELGLPGLIMWLAFIFWALSRPHPFRPGRWSVGRRLGWLNAVFMFSMAMIGTGLFTTIPETAMMMLMMGWLVVPLRVDRSDYRPVLAQPSLPSGGFTGNHLFEDSQHG